MPVQERIGYGPGDIRVIAVAEGEGMVGVSSSEYEVMNDKYRTAVAEQRNTNIRIVGEIYLAPQPEELEWGLVE